MRRTYTTIAALSLLVALSLGASAQGMARKRVAVSGPTRSTTDVVIDVSGYAAPRKQTSQGGRRARLNRVNRRPQITGNPTTAMAGGISYL
jgi:hypothetical protein